MRTSRSAGRRLGVAAVAALLLASAGPAVLPATAAGPPAGATAPAAPAGTDDAVSPLLKPGDSVRGLGRTGFLSQEGDDPYAKRWTRLLDGAVTTFPDTGHVSLSLDSDVVVLQKSGSFTLRDMAADKELLSVPLRLERYAGAVGSHLFTRAALSGQGPLEVYSPGPDGPVRRTVTGLPADASELGAVAGAGDEALVTYTTGAGTTTAARHWAVVDLTTAAVTSSGRNSAGGSSMNRAYALSTGYVAWTEVGQGAGTDVVVLDRATRREQRFHVSTASRLLIGLVGKWVTYSHPGGLQADRADTAHALTARSLTGTATRELLDHTVSAAGTSGESHGFVGGTVAGGEGLYRIAPGTDGVPAATRLVATGAPTKVTLLRHTAPTAVDLDRAGGVSLAWYLSRNNVNMWVTLRNTRTGESLKEHIDESTRDEDPRPMRFEWNGTLDWQATEGFWTSASAGPYTWEINAAPLNGIGPTLKASGSFTVTRKTGAHDYDSDGSPDVLARDTSGRLWIQDVHHHPGWNDTTQNPDSPVGGGWQIYDRIEATGNLGGTGTPDLVARDRAGVLWLYRGTGVGKAPFTGRTRIGDGWSTYVHLTGGSDLTGDGRPDLVATDRSGKLWMYRGTGVASAPFAARRLIGSGGWQTYDRITATGNLAGGPAGDLVARDRAGVLWLYLGKGDGTFAARTRVGGGWGAYTDLVGSGDLDRDGKPDLYVTTPDHSRLSPGVHRGTGDWRAPFRSLGAVHALHNSRSFNLLA
ncbi:FG-GAP repeat domain-containing protein [Streptomyces sp. NPDC058486]|uniref:FG-GAP repeat domain-containing protein n=1 Tax=unclassified Streptomyces TaxID=2593676 RepID=UPI003650D275